MLLEAKNPDGKLTAAQETKHVLAHTILGAATALATGNNALSGGISSGGAEAVAPLIQNYLYPDVKTENLTPEQKATVSNIASLVGAGAAGLTSGGNGADIAAGNNLAANAVENNYLTTEDWDKYHTSIADCGAGSNQEGCLQKNLVALRKVSDEANKKLDATCGVRGDIEQCKVLISQVDNAVQNTKSQIKQLEKSTPDNLKPVLHQLEKYDKVGEHNPNIMGMRAIIEIEKLNALGADPNNQAEIKKDPSLFAQIQKDYNNLSKIVLNEGRGSDTIWIDSGIKTDNLTKLGFRDIGIGTAQPVYADIDAAFILSGPVKSLTKLTYTKGEQLFVKVGEKIKISKTSNEIITSDRVGSGLKDDISHIAASFLSKKQLKEGKVFDLLGADKVKRKLLQVENDLNGKKGIYEYIYEFPNKITHQRFIEGGRITGHPNQKIK